MYQVLTRRLWMIRISVDRPNKKTEDVS